MTRVYLPSSAARLARLAVERGVGPAPLEAYAVTPALRAALPDLDEEGLEYVATLEAARASLRLTAADGSAARRIVLAADVPDTAVSAAPDAGVAGVTLSAPVPIADTASIHADDADAEPAVRAALADLASAALLDALEEHDLLWWATQELEDLLTLLS